MMEAVTFADILMIMVICGVILAILVLVNRSAQKNVPEQENSSAPSSRETVDKKTDE